MERNGSTSMLAERPKHGNGGFPVPAEGDPVRIVRATHTGCRATRIRLPREVPAAAVREAICDGCLTRFECTEVEEVRGLGDRSLTALRPPEWLEQRPGSVWAWISVPLAAALVVAALALLQGGEVSDRAAGPTLTEITEQNKVVARDGFTLVLPPGWGSSDAPEGAALAAASADGGADVVLFVSREPGLSFDTFLERSLGQVTELTGNASVIERIDAPTPPANSVRIRGESSQSGVPVTYDVTLRMSGELRYYLATTLVDGASPEARNGIDILHESLIPAPKESLR